MTPAPDAPMTAGADTRGDQPARDLSERVATPRVVWLITAVFGCLLLLYSILFPSYRGPDEPQHVDLTLYVQETWRYPEYDGRFIGASIIDSLDFVEFHERSEDLAARGVPRRDSRAALVDVIPESASPNQLPQHPPLYYYTMALANEVVDVVTPGDSLNRPFDRTVWTLRLFNLLLLLPLPVITYRLVRGIGARHEVGVAAALMLLAIPQLTHIGAVVNNDNLLVLLMAVLTLYLLRIARGDLSTRTAVIAGIVSGLALFTKASALFIPVWIGLAYFLGGRDQGLMRRAGRRFALAGVLALLAGGWWWIRNLVVHGSVLVGIRQLPLAPDTFTPDPLWWLRRFVEWIIERYWGWFGWFDVRIPLWSVAFAMALVIGGVALAFLSRRGSGKRALFFLLIFPTLVIGGLVMAGAYRGYLKTGLTPAIQGRYLFPGVVGLVAVTMFGLQRLVRRGGHLVLLAAGFVALMQTVGVLTALHFYWAPGGAGPLWEEARSMVAWSPWPGEFVVVLAVIGVVLGIWLIHDIVRPLRGAFERPTRGADEPVEAADA